MLKPEQILKPFCFTVRTLEALLRTFECAKVHWSPLGHLTAQNVTKQNISKYPKACPICWLLLTCPLLLTSTCLVSGDLFSMLTEIGLQTSKEHQNVMPLESISRVDTVDWQNFNDWTSVCIYSLVSGIPGYFLNLPFWPLVSLSSQLAWLRDPLAWKP